MEESELFGSDLLERSARGFPSTYDRSCLCIYEACRAGDLQNIIECLSNDPLILDTPDAFNATPIYYAALCGHEEVVRFLLDKGAKCDSSLYEGERALYGALTDNIRYLLHEAQAAERHIGGPLTIFLARVFNDHSERGFCDFVFHFPDASAHPDVHVHRAVLAGRSPYFSEKFKGVWIEKRETTLRDPRLSYPALLAVLRCLYTDRLSFPAFMLPEILSIAKNLRLVSLTSSLSDLLSCAAVLLSTVRAASFSLDLAASRSRSAR